MAAIIGVILGIIGIASLLSLFIVVKHEVYCVRDKDWLSGLFGIALMVGCLLIAFACFGGIGFII